MFETVKTASFSVPKSIDLAGVAHVRLRRHVQVAIRPEDHRLGIDMPPLPAGT